MNKLIEKLNIANCTEKGGDSAAKSHINDTKYDPWHNAILNDIANCQSTKPKAKQRRRKVDLET